MQPLTLWLINPSDISIANLYETLIAYIDPIRLYGSLILPKVALKYANRTYRFNHRSSSILESPNTRIQTALWSKVSATRVSTDFCGGCMNCLYPTNPTYLYTNCPYSNYSISTVKHMLHDSAIEICFVHDSEFYIYLWSSRHVRNRAWHLGCFCNPNISLGVSDRS